MISNLSLEFSARVSFKYSCQIINVVPNDICIIHIYCNIIFAVSDLLKRKMNGPHDKFDFLPDSSALTNTEDHMSRRLVGTVQLYYYVQN